MKRKFALTLALALPLLMILQAVCAVLPAVDPVFIDLASVEYSRDTEMMRGGYFDNYYMQLAQNIQRVKGTAPS